MLLERAHPLGLGLVQPAVSASLASCRPRRFLRSVTMTSLLPRILSARMRGLPANALAPAVAILLAATACSRQDGVALSGYVYDPSGSRIPHALVLITDPEQEVTEATTAGPDGAFQIEGLAPSPSYEIEVQGPAGFEPGVQNLDLTADRHLDIELDIEPIVEAVVISGPPPQQGSVRSGEPRRRVRVGGNVRKARLVHYVAPTFPADAEREGNGGTVQFEGVIGNDGRIAGLSRLNSIVDERLAAAATEAVLQWRYDPTLLNGLPVAASVTISVAFEIP